MSLSTRRPAKLIVMIIRAITYRNGSAIILKSLGRSFKKARTATILDIGKENII